MAFEVYLLIGLAFGLYSKVKGFIDEQLDNDETFGNTLWMQLLILLFIVLFWLPVILYLMFSAKEDN